MLPTRCPLQPNRKQNYISYFRSSLHWFVFSSKLSFSFFDFLSLFSCTFVFFFLLSLFSRRSFICGSCFLSFPSLTFCAFLHLSNISHFFSIQEKIFCQLFKRKDGADGKKLKLFLKTLIFLIYVYLKSLFIPMEFNSKKEETKTKRK